MKCMRRSGTDCKNIGKYETTECIEEFFNKKTYDFLEFSEYFSVFSVVNFSMKGDL